MGITTKIDICMTIKKGDTVEIVPDYSYMIGSAVRIGDYFKVKPGEVVIKKTQKFEVKDEVTLIKCKRVDLDIER